MAENTNKVIMKNSFMREFFYKSKGIASFEVSTGVDYGIVTPFMHIKFASRADHKSPGQWNDQNCFWITGLFAFNDFEMEMNKLLTKKAEVIEFKNPMKKTYIGFRSSFDDKSKIQYYILTYTRGSDAKISISLQEKEAINLYKAIKSFIDNYHTIAQMTLMRQDTWFNLYGKNKVNQDNKKPDYEKKYETKKESPRQQEPDSFMTDIENEIGGANFSDDVPF